MPKTIAGPLFTEKNARNYWLKVDKTDLDGCWLWTSPPSTSGYGTLWVGGKVRYAHRIAYELANGPIPIGLVVRHGPCGDKLCVQPRHLMTGTQADNVDDHRHGWLWRELEAIPLTEPERDLIRLFLPIAEAVIAEGER